MRRSSAPIIATPPLAAPRPAPAGRYAGPRRLPLWCGAIAAVWGTGAAWWYFAQGLALSHYDAKAHLVVARRIIDSLTPGWQQVGAVWLPLPHLLNMVPVQVDAFYRTGAFATAMSVLSLGVGAWALARLVLRGTGSVPAALVGVALLALNPNLLYLHATPMTEPLLIGLLLLATMALHGWVQDGSVRLRRVAAWALAAACLTRYEAWPFTAAALALTAAARRATGTPVSDALRDAAGLGSYPMAAILLFMLNSRLSVGAWFVTGGFYEIDATLQGHPWAVTRVITWGAASLGSHVLIAAAGAGVLLILLAALPVAPGIARHVPPHARAALVVPLALLAVAALPWYAFIQGHPFRIRYMIPLIVGAMVSAAIAVGLLPRGLFQRAAALVLLLMVLRVAPPFDTKAAMLQEAQWDRPNSRGRAVVTACLAPAYRGEGVMASMGSLAHYMQELSEEGFHIRDFLHEGNGDLWAAALERGPHHFVGWVLVAEQATVRDALARHLQAHPEFLAGLERVCEGGGVTLYRSARP